MDASYILQETLRMERGERRGERREESRSCLLFCKHVRSCLTHRGPPLAGGPSHVGMRILVLMLLMVVVVVLLMARRLLLLLTSLLSFLSNS